MQGAPGLCGAGGGRTRTLSLTEDFKSSASAYSATAPMDVASKFYYNFRLIAAKREKKRTHGPE